jgi:oxygen-independent coproporphyrinogen-3 oxidase
MAGVYIHIPYCSQACHYCNFHFSTQLKSSAQMLEAMCLEIEMRKNELPQPLKTIYFGGGTPSILAVEHLHQ